MQLLSRRLGWHPSFDYGFSLEAAFTSANRHGVAAVSDYDGVLGLNGDIRWRALRKGTEQSDQRQSGQQYFNCLVHRGSLPGWILMRAAVYARVLSNAAVPICGKGLFFWCSNEH
jgi:hypothetical protein